MKIRAHGFAKLEGTVFVLTYVGGDVAQAVFKTVKAAQKFSDNAKKFGTRLETRVGHFANDRIIETI